MKRVRTIVNTLIVVVVLTPLAIAAFAWSGWYNVAATDAHWPVTKWVIETTVHRAVDRRATDISVPDLDARERLTAGIESYEAMCAGCHAPPGGEKSALAKGLYPAPPDLGDAAREMDAGKLFWVVKHGVKASGMPAWGPTHDDDVLWDIVALVQRFPDMPGERYAALKATASRQSRSHDEHHEPDEAHSHGADQDGPDKTESTDNDSQQDGHGGHDHH